MTPPKPLLDASRTPEDAVPAVSSCGDAKTPAPPALSVLQKRSDFLAASRAKRQGGPAMMLQARRRDPLEPADGIRVGFTCSKKVGNAVARNRAKRRLREVARMVLPAHGKPGWDYVLIGRRDATAERDFQALLQDLKRALDKIHGPRSTPRDGTEHGPGS